MNKIICDVCGTDYPETAAQCPICGCASVGAQTTAGNETPDGETGAAYTHVKGGRYSKANVRKRLKANQVPYAPIPKSDPEPEYEDDDAQQVEDEEEEERGSNGGLIAVVVILLLANIAVAAYIAISIFGLGSTKTPDATRQPDTYQTAPTTAAPTTDPTTEPTTVPASVACTDLSGIDVDIHLESVGDTWQLTVIPVPADTTDKVKFTSSDETVVTVDDSGLVTAVGTGEASIIIACGEVVKDCPVLCGSEEPDDTDIVEGFVLTLRREDFTLDEAGDTFNLYKGEVDAADITWTSSNEKVVTIEDGVVTAVGKGRTQVHAEYGDQKVSCWVSVKG